MSDGIKLGFLARIDESRPIPAEFQVFPYGLVRIEGSEPFVVDEESMAGAIERFRARGLDMVIDYEHQTEGADYASPDGRAPAAGWIRELENRGRDGLWAKVQWTQKAQEYLENREYRYYSPVFLVSKGTRRLVELLRVALTNAPRLNWIKPIVARAIDLNPEKEKQMEFLKHIAKLLGLSDAATEEEVAAEVKALRTAGDFVKLGAKETGLPETATGGQVIAAIKSLHQPGPACREVLDALGLEHEASRSEIVATIHALRQRPDAPVIQEVAMLKAKLAARDRDELVAAALKDGKITPAQKEWAEKYALDDPEGFKLFVARAPQVVPVGGPKPAGGTARHGLDGNQLHINKLLGVSEEEFKKYNPAEA